MLTSCGGFQSARSLTRRSPWTYRWSAIRCQDCSSWSPQCGLTSFSHPASEYVRAADSPATTTSCSKHLIPVLAWSPIGSANTVQAGNAFREAAAEHLQKRPSPESGELENTEVRALPRQGPARVKAQICKGLLRNRYGLPARAAFAEVRAVQRREVAN